MGSRVAVVGTGYVGLATGACLAQLGHTVVCADIEPKKVAMLQRGEVPILEDGLPELVRSGLDSGQLRFVLGACEAVVDAEFVFMCLPTPQGADGHADLSFLLGAAKEVGPFLAEGAVVINKSTVPVGSAQQVAMIMSREDVAIASNPEFLKEGTAVYDFFNPDRIVIGAASQHIAERVASLYAALDASMLLVDTPTAELIKYAANAYLATKLSFVNDVANLAATLGANGNQVLAGVGMDSRIGQSFMRQGPGWGGSCFPKDTQALLAISKAVGYDFSLLGAVVEANEAQLQRMVAKVAQLVGGNLSGKRIAAWGLTFKAGTDDTRKSPAIAVLSALAEAGADVHAYDPQANQGVPSFITQHADALSACDNADTLVVLTEWSEFAEVPLREVARRMAQPCVLDTRSLLQVEDLRRLGFFYEVLGQEASEPVVV